MTDTEQAALNMQIEILRQQIELEESNYKYAVELGNDYEMLLMLRDHINKQKQHLYALIETTLNVQNKHIE